MPKYEVTNYYSIERALTHTVEAESEEEAVEKARELDQEFNLPLHAEYSDSVAFIREN